jgi:cytochrome c oxidase subunit 3
MSTVEKKRIHPQMFALYIAMASIGMMFAGLTSAYIVRKSQDNWRIFEIPAIFWASTIAIVLSSVTLIVALKKLKNRELAQSKRMVVLSLVLGLSFGILQYIGFHELYNMPNPVRVEGNPSESFLFIIWGLHLLHIAGGIVALVIVLFRLNRMKPEQEYNTNGNCRELLALFRYIVDLSIFIYNF